jgi:hypothetical protein
MSERIVGLFCQSSGRFIPSQIITATIKRPDRTSPGAPFLFSLVPRSVSQPRPFPTTGSAQINAIPVRREAASMCPGDDGWQALAEMIGRDTSAIGAHPDSTTRCGRAVTCAIDQGADTATSASAHRIGRWQWDAERGMGGDPTLNIERGVGRNETLNVEAGVGGKCRVISRRAEGRRSGLNGSDEVSEAAREHSPGEPGKAA